MKRATDETFTAASWYAIREFKSLTASEDGVERDERFREGVVSTPAGLVWVYSEEGLSNYHVVLEGQSHTRSEERTRSDSELARGARKFVKELTGKKG
ncbi:MAG TPA: hypothetical protein VNM92_07555 [Thermoanaerobaculia bacterium]|nr:hypothetical protein [Thermoanaerobaculia bacterium]